jgi:hypothetical protein
MLVSGPNVTPLIEHAGIGSWRGKGVTLVEEGLSQSEKWAYLP